MSILPIIEYPDPLLRQVSHPIQDINKDIKKLIEDMFETMYNAKGVGLSAIQVGYPLRLIVMDIDGESPKYFINPKISQFSEISYINKEGCLSFPGKFLDIQRPYSCVVNYRNIKNKRKRDECKGFYSICIQHEMDHLNGILFEDKT